MLVWRWWMLKFSNLNWRDLVMSHPLLRSPTYHQPKIYFFIKSPAAVYTSVNKTMQDYKRIARTAQNHLCWSQPNVLTHAPRFLFDHSTYRARQQILMACICEAWWISCCWQHQLVVMSNSWLLPTSGASANEFNNWPHMTFSEALGR